MSRIRQRETPMNQPFAFNQGKPLVTEEAGVTVRKVGAHFGAEITGINLRKPLSDAQFRPIEAALYRVDAHGFHQRKIDEKPIIAHCASGDVVAAAADG
jgi:hypothetical protein